MKKSYKVKIIGAGSIGNHLAHGCRQKNWSVTLFDIDPEALERTRTELYPQRYGHWDSEIVLTSTEPNEEFDVVIIGTPPSSHVSLALKELNREFPPKILLIEKPLARPEDPILTDLKRAIDRSNTHVLVGFNHNVTPNTVALEKLLSEGRIGQVHGIHTVVRESVDYILNAHPWIEHPSQSYLYNADQGGGALFEHSHALSFWCHVARMCDFGRVESVMAASDIQSGADYSFDQAMSLVLKTDRGRTGTVEVDFLSQPAMKRAEVVGDRGRIVWHVNKEFGKDVVDLFMFDGTTERYEFSKTRPDDFVGEIDVMQSLLEGLETVPLGLSWESGLEVQNIIESAHRSARLGRSLNVMASEELEKVQQDSTFAESPLHV